MDEKCSHPKHVDKPGVRKFWREIPSPDPAAFAPGGQGFPASGGERFVCDDCHEKYVRGTLDADSYIPCA